MIESFLKICSFLIIALFSLSPGFCVCVFFFGSDHHFGISFCPPCNVRGKCGTRDGCALVVEFASKEEARS